MEDEITSNNMNQNTTQTSIPNGLLFPVAEQPDIVRAALKDEYYHRVLYKDLIDCCLRTFGPRWTQIWRQEIDLWAHALYFASTTLSGKQTLGEEYCDIVQIQGSSQTTVASHIRFGLGLLVVVVPYLVKRTTDKLLYLSRPGFHRPSLHSRGPEPLGTNSLWDRLGSWYNGIHSKIDSISLKPRIAKMLQSLIPNVSHCLDLIRQIHLALFYLFGRYYDISKRLLGIEYIFNRSLDFDRPRYGILGILIIIQLFVRAVIWGIEKSTLRTEQEDLDDDGDGDDDDDLGDDEGNADGIQDDDPESKCTLCLERRRRTAATLCGHLFCWNCILECCKVKAECPICRREIAVASIIRLYNI